MPLARGTAACGYTAILSLFWAASMPVTASIPKDYQVDWEAILNQHPDAFVESVSKWIYPSEARGGMMGSTSAKQPSQQVIITAYYDGSCMWSVCFSVQTRRGLSVASMMIMSDETFNSPPQMFPSVDTLSPISDVLHTLRNRIEALNGESSKRL